MAEWIAEQGVLENVMLRAEGSHVLVPCGTSWTIKGEVKNVVTVIAKTTHYWADHVPSEMKAALAVQEGLKRFGAVIRGMLRKR
jgi:hypothetical protein